MERSYEQQAISEMRAWQDEMRRKPNLADKVSSGLQHRMNKVVPEKLHHAITVAFRQMVNGVLTGAGYVGRKPLLNEDLTRREILVRDKITVYKNTAALEGAITGAGGILLGLADFPLWLGIKMKMLADIASLYGHDISDFKERVYLLYVFQLAFSSKKHRRKVYEIIEDWDRYSAILPASVSHNEWRAFQQEYRDYLDIAKLLQLIPGIGAVVGAYVNNKLTFKLGATAMNAYRMRWFKQKQDMALRLGKE